MEYNELNRRTVEIVEIDIGKDLYNKFKVEKHFESLGYKLNKWSKYIDKEGYLLRFERIINV